MPSQIIFVCPVCGTEFAVTELYNDEYVECPNPDCATLIDVGQYFTDWEQQKQDEADVLDEWEEGP